MNATPRLRRVGSARRRLFYEPLEVRLLLATVTVNAAANQHAINPLIYGVGGSGELFGGNPSPTALADAGISVDRFGGNLATRYNWQLDASNHASDYFFESIASGDGTPGKAIDDFTTASLQGGAASYITIPTIDYVAKLGANRSILPSFSVAKYGPQKQTDPFLADAGNGLHTDGTKVTGNDPLDANVSLTSAMQSGMVQHLVQQFGTAANGGVKFYALDNEWGLWHETHRDVHPQGVTMDEELSKTLATAAVIRSADPSAKILGPEEWGYLGYIYSGADKQFGDAHGYANPPDRAAHGGMDNIPWLLDQLHQADANSGQRSLDVLTVHYYPQGTEYSNNTSTATELLRNRSTRSLWDPNYTDETYQGDSFGQLQVIPKLQQWVNQYYPGTQVGITEYSWGADGHMSGATAQADVLGIFGREGLDLGTRFGMPTTDSPAYDAIKMYRNYDDAGDGFGDTSVSATVANPDELSAFASTRASDGALTVMVVNKTLVDTANPNTTTPLTIDISNFLHGDAAKVWQLAANNQTNLTVSSINQLSDVALAGNSLTVNVPRQSVTLFVIPRGGNANPVVANLGGAVMYAENGAAKLLATTATVSDVDSPNFASGKLTVTLASGFQTTDQLTIRNAVNVSTSGANVLVAGQNIGTFTGGSEGTPLVITLRGAATPPRVQTLLRNITFQNNSENPTAADRTLMVQLTDGDGGTSALVSKAIHVTPVNDAPVIAPATGGTFNYHAGAPGLAILSAATIADPDSANFDGGRMTVHTTAGTNANNRFTLGNAFSISGNNVFYNTTLIGMRNNNGGVGTTPLTVFFNANATRPIVQQLLRAIRFSTVGGQPTQRTISTLVTDGDGGTSNSVNVTVNVTA